VNAAVVGEPVLDLAALLRAGLIAFPVALFAALALTPVVRRLAHAGALLDHPDGQRKLHDRPLPRLGGVAVYFAFALAFAAMAFLVPRSAWELGAGGGYAHLVAAGGVVMLVGLLDDLRGASPAAKLAVQMAAAAYLWTAGYRMDIVTNPFGEPITLGALSLPVTVLWFVGLSNAFNLVDGLDGLAAGLALIATTSLFAASLLNDRWGAALLILALAGALLGFLRYNWPPATIFLGDSGALFVGFVLAGFAIRSNMKSSTVIAVTAPILALALPILDASLAVARRVANGHNVFRADREHLHHRLLRLGLPPRHAVLALCLVGGLFGSLSLLSLTTSAQAVGASALLVLVVVLLATRRGKRPGLALPATSSMAVSKPGA
jgi:UDP-GlcNAc:undecaprenyl-phosphate GlcNAc-1-phosphate transferase